MDKKDLPYQNKGDLTTGPVKNHLVRMTVPMIWGMFAIIAVQLTDTYFVARLGTTQLAGISFTFPVTMIISHLVFGLNIALSSVISRTIGQKKMDDVRRITLHGIILAVVVSFTISACCYLALDPLFRELGADDLTLPVVREYMPLWLIASVVLAMPVNANASIRAAGDTLTPSLVMIMIALINLALNPVLIFGLLGAPALGVKGAALATLIAYICGALMALYVVTVKKNLLSRDGLHLDKFKDSLKKLAVIAIPAGLATIIQPVTNAIIVAMLAGYGAEAVAVYGVATRVEAFAMIFVIALSIGMAPIVGQNWGAERYDRVKEVINLAILFNFAWSFGVAILLTVFARPIAAAFSDDPVIVDHIALYFRIVSFTYAFGNLLFGWSSAFNAMGKPLQSFVMIVIRAFVMTVPAVYIGGLLGGVQGIFLAIALVNIASGLIFHVVSQRSPHLNV